MQKTAAVIIHGWTATPPKFEFEISWFGGEVDELISLTLPGHATDHESEKDKARELSRFSYRDWIAYVEEQLNAVAKREDVGRVIVIGHSMSGYLALLAAKKMGKMEQEKLHVGMVNAPYKLRFWLFGLMLHLCKFPLPFLEHRIMIPKGGETGSNKIATWKSVHDLNKIIRLGKKALPVTKVPLLIVQSQNDPSVKVQSAECIRNRTPIGTPFAYGSLPGGHTPSIKEKQGIARACVKAFRLPNVYVD
jgi:carboxylesterase